MLERLYVVFLDIIDIRYLLIAEPHLPPRVSRDIHAAQEDPLLVTVVEDGGAGVLGLKAPHQLGLD